MSPLNNHGNLIVSLGQLVPWLGTQAEAAGVDVFPGFAAEPFDDAGSIGGVRIGDMGLDKDGGEGPNCTPGVEIVAGDDSAGGRGARLASASS